MSKIYTYDNNIQDLERQIKDLSSRFKQNQSVIRIFNQENSSVLIITTDGLSLNTVVVNLNTEENYFNIFDNLEKLIGLSIVNHKVIDINNIMKQFIKDNILIDFQKDKFIIRLKKSINDSWAYEGNLYFTSSLVFNNLEEDASNRIKKRIKSNIKRMVIINEFIEENANLVLQYCNTIEHINKISLISMNTFNGEAIATFRKFCKSIVNSKISFIDIFEGLKEEEVIKIYKQIINPRYSKQTSNVILYSKNGIQLSKIQETNPYLHLQCINSVATSYLNFKVLFALIKMFGDETVFIKQIKEKSDVSC